jgi:hypothetical protein
MAINGARIADQMGAYCDQMGAHCDQMALESTRICMAYAHVLQQCTI